VILESDFFVRKEGSVFYEIAGSKVAIAPYDPAGMSGSSNGS
jgi:hypothetical protein